MKEKCVQKYLEHFKIECQMAKRVTKVLLNILHVSDVSFNVVTLLDNREI